MVSGLRFHTDLRFLFLIVFLATALVIWIRTATVKATYEYVQNEKEYRLLNQEIQALRVKWLKVSAPKRLEGMAHVLKLGPPKIDQVMKYEIQPENRPK